MLMERKTQGNPFPGDPLPEQDTGGTTCSASGVARPLLTLLLVSPCFHSARHIPVIYLEGFPREKERTLVITAKAFPKQDKPVISSVLASVTAL